MLLLGSLPFKWANRSVHDLGKWYAKFGTGKFCPGMAFTIYTNQSHLPKNDREGLKLVSKMALKKWNTTFRLAYSVQNHLFKFSEASPRATHKSCSLYFSTGFSGNYL